MSNICEHGHLARKCEVCELEERASETSCLIQELTQACCNKNVEIEKLKAEIARLRSVCRMGSDYACGIRGHTQPRSLEWIMLNNLVKDLADAGKEPSDGL